MRKVKNIHEKNYEGKKSEIHKENHCMRKRQIHGENSEKKVKRCMKKIMRTKSRDARRNF